LRGYLKPATKSHFFVEPDWLKQPWLVCALVDSPNALSLMALIGLLLELGAIPIALASSSPTLLGLLAVAGTCFHIGNALLMGIIFPFNLPCYALALLPTGAHDPSCVAHPAALLTALTLGLTTWFSLEDWPWNAMVLFPYNYEQQEAISTFYDTLHLTFRANGASSTVCKGESSHTCAPNDTGSVGPHLQQRLCLVKKAVNKDPAMFEPEVSWALLAAGGSERSRGSRQEAVYEEMRKFVIRRRPYVDRCTFRCFDNLIIAATPEAKDYISSSSAHGMAR
jgi:hypothetical protein